MCNRNLQRYFCWPSPITQLCNITYIIIFFNEKSSVSASFSQHFCTQNSPAFFVEKFFAAADTVSQHLRPGRDILSSAQRERHPHAAPAAVPARLPGCGDMPCPAPTYARCVSPGLPPAADSLPDKPTPPPAPGAAAAASFRRERPAVPLSAGPSFCSTPRTKGGIQP